MYNPPETVYICIYTEYALTPYGQPSFQPKLHTFSKYTFRPTYIKTALTVVHNVKVILSQNGIFMYDWRRSVSKTGVSHSSKQALEMLSEPQTGMLSRAFYCCARLAGY